MSEKWGIDNSAGRPILVYENCSVIEGEQAEFALLAIQSLTAAQERIKALESECAQAWEQFRRMRALCAEAKYGDRLKNQVLLTKDADLSTQENTQ